MVRCHLAAAAAAAVVRLLPLPARRAAFLNIGHYSCTMKRMRVRAPHGTIASSWPPTEPLSVITRCGHGRMERHKLLAAAHMCGSGCQQRRRDEQDEQARHRGDCLRYGAWRLGSRHCRFVVGRTRSGVGLHVDPARSLLVPACPRGCRRQELVLVRAGPLSRYCVPVCRPCVPGCLIQALAPSVADGTRGTPRQRTPVLTDSHAKCAPLPEEPTTNTCKRITTPSKPPHYHTPIHIPTPNQEPPLVTHTSRSCVSGKQNAQERSGVCC